MLSLTLVLNLLNLIVSIIPNWNLSSSAIDLLSSSNNYEYSISDRYLWARRVNLRKKIERNGNMINHTNYLDIDGQSEIEVDFENIESYSRNLIICPKGKYHPFNYHTNNYTISSNFEDKGNWDLKCYSHDTGYFLVFYLNNDKILYYNYEGNEFKSILININKIFDFKLENGENTVNNAWIEYKMLALIYDDEYIKLKLLQLEFHEHDMNDDGIYFIEYDSFPEELNLAKGKKYNQAIFNNISDEFYFFTYNNISDFSSGYSSITNLDYHIENVLINNNKESPFEFVDVVEIKEMNFLLNNKYIYYSIYNIQRNITYHGIYDIKLNKIIFNTDEDIDVFIPYSNNAMLAITKETAYKICIIKDNYNNCIEECPFNNKILDVDGNKCGTSCDNNKYLLIPYNICINECNISIFVFDSNKNCGLCKDMNSSKPYKIIGSQECLSEIPINTEIYNSKLYLLKCKEDYYLNNGRCEKICKNKNCLLCNEESDELNLCTNCNKTEGYIKVNYNSFYNCVKIDDPILSNFYYEQEEDAYYPCYNLCKKCIKGGNEDSHNCLECIDGYILKPGNNTKNICVEYSEFYYISKGEYHPLEFYQCPEVAKFSIYEKNSCIDECSLDNEYKYTFNGKCLKDCPNYTINENYFCKVDSNKCYSSETNFNFRKNITLDQIRILVDIYLYEFNYTRNFVSLYKTNYNKLIFFENSSCVVELDIFTTDLREYYYKIIEDYNLNINSILSILICDIYPEQILIFNISTKDLIYMGNLYQNINKTQLNVDSTVSVELISNSNMIYENISDLHEIIKNFDGNNILEKQGKKYYQISYLSNQTENLSVINLGNCENIIKTENGIDLEEELIILKNEYYIPEFQIPIIDYQIYDKQGNQLSLDSCSNTSIEYEIPVTINESEIYKYDPNSFYYNDFCYPAESRNGIDMTIYDRKNE